MANSEGRERELQEQAAYDRPHVLDLVKLDGRWAQVISGPERSQVIYLDDGSGDAVDWGDYELARSLGTHVRLLQEREKAFSDEELARIRWGSEQDTTPDLINEVSVFGEYKKRE